MTKTFFEKIVQHPSAHARFVNSLSFIEYIGARKILKGQRAQDFSLELLSHASEEIRHAQILKRLALRISPEVVSYQREHLLAGERAEGYIQEVDRAVEEALGKNKTWQNYLVTTLVVEERAETFYTEYEKVLAECGYGGILISIVKEEVGHLKKMREWLSQEAIVSEDRLLNLRKVESNVFDSFLNAALREI